MLVVSYIYDLPFWRDQSTLLRNLLGGWQISGATFLQSGTPFSITRTNDIAGVGEGSNGQPVDLVGDMMQGANGKFSLGTGLDTNFAFNPAAFANPAAGKFGNSTRNILRNPGAQQWDIALFKNFVLGGSAPAPVPRGGVQLHQPSEPERPECRHHEPELRAHHHQGRLAARRPARAAVHLLSLALR